MNCITKSVSQMIHSVLNSIINADSSLNFQDLCHQTIKTTRKRKYRKINFLNNF